jgi:DMSO/TMAO reductase YedYZ molybdopterin-dependent catalytic subunit
MGGDVNRRKFMRLAAAGLSSALAPLSCAKQVGQQIGTSHYPTPKRPLTPVAAWYKMSILGAYEADRAKYRLKVGGVADVDLSLSLDQLESEFDLGVEMVTLSCVGNTPGGNLMSGGYFRGVRLQDLMDRAKVSDKATGAFITGLDGFISYQSMDDLSRRESLIALHLGEEPDELQSLPIENGWPCRILTPGLYGYMQPKWIDSIEFIDQGGYQRVLTKSIPYFEGKIQLASGFSRPRSSQVDAGPYEVLGFAFGDGRTITKVEVSIDGEAWRPAEIVFNSEHDDKPGYLWVLWRFEWVAATGLHKLRCRATYADGATQYEGQRFPYSGGSITEIQVYAKGSTAASPIIAEEAE